MRQGWVLAFATMLPPCLVCCIHPTNNSINTNHTKNCHNQENSSPVCQVACRPLGGSRKLIPTRSPKRPSCNPYAISHNNLVDLILDVLLGACLGSCFASKAYGHRPQGSSQAEGHREWHIRHGAALRYVAACVFPTRQYSTVTCGSGYLSLGVGGGGELVLLAGACREIKGASSTQRLMGCMDISPFLAKQTQDEMEAGVHIT